MSEYQYYEFQTIDKPLSDADIEELRDISSRAEITRTSFKNVYNYGDFRGSPKELMELYFDAFVYVANWGTHWLMLRFPRKLLDLKIVSQYCVGESASYSVTDDHIILEFQSEEEDYDWEEDEGWLSNLISLRSELLHGDYRILYLAWLLCAENGELNDKDIEPPVPPNLCNLNAGLEYLTDFLRIDINLVEVATQNSIEDNRGNSREELNQWIKGLSLQEKDEYLLRMMTGNASHQKIELLQKFMDTEQVKNHSDVNNVGRTVAELLKMTETYAEEKEQRIAEQKAKERVEREKLEAIAREKYLNDLVIREESVWLNVYNLIDSKKPANYDEAVKLLKDLRDVSKKKGKAGIFEGKMQNIFFDNKRKVSFIERLRNAGMKLTK